MAKAREIQAQADTGGQKKLGLMDGSTYLLVNESTLPS